MNMKLKNLLSMTFVLCLVLAGCTQMRPQTQASYDTIEVVENTVVDEYSVPIFPRKAGLTTDTARRFAIDLPKRCKVDWDNQNIMSVIPAQPVEIVRLNKGDNLPDFAVEDFAFKKKNVPDVLENLLKGTKDKGSCGRQYARFNQWRN